MKCLRFQPSVAHTLLLPALTLTVIPPHQFRGEVATAGLPARAGLGIEPATSANLPLVPLARKLLKGSSSAIIMHDGSSEAQTATQDLTRPQPIPLQVGDISRLLDDPFTLSAFIGHEQNTDTSLTLLVFSNVSVVDMFLATRSLDWVTSPLLLLSLSPDDAREILREAGQVRWCALLQALPSTRRPALTTHVPFSPPRTQYVTQVLKEEGELTRGLVAVERRSNFYGQQLEVASWVDDFPFLYYDKSQQEQGLTKLMLDEVAARLHFTYHMQGQPPDGYWGEMVNGTWMGMVGQLVRGEKDIIINGFAILLDRYHALHYSVPYFTDSYSASLKVPPAMPRWESVVYPFRPVVWAAVAASVLVLAPIFHLIIRRRPHLVYTHKADVVSTALWLGRVLVKQAASRVPGGAGSRSLLGAWWLVGVVLSASYTGSIIAFLTVPAKAPRIATLTHLAAAPQSLFLLDYGAFLPGYLNNSVDSVYRRLSHKLHLLDTYDHIREKLEGGDAFVEATRYMQSMLIQWRMTDAYVVEEAMFPNHQGWAFRKGTHWAHLFDRYLNMMVETGLVDHWHRATVASFRRENDLPPSSGKVSRGALTLQPLSLRDTQGIFLLLVLGMALALITLAVEFLCHGCHQSPRGSLQ